MLFIQGINSDKIKMKKRKIKLRKIQSTKFINMRDFSDISRKIYFKMPK